MQGRADFFRPERLGRKRGHGPAARFDEFKPRMLEHDMRSLPPEAFKVPEVMTRKESVELHHQHDPHSLNDWNTHWVSKEIGKPKLFYILGEGKGKGAFGAEQTLGLGAKEVFGMIPPQQHDALRLLHERHRGKRTYPDREDPPKYGHQRNHNKIG